MRLNLLISILLAASAGALASAQATASETIRADGLRVEIVADDGTVFARYDLARQSRPGTLRAYVQAEHGRNYGIRVRNDSGGRIGLVIAVDGRNILSGEKSSLGSDEPMYVLGAFQRATYEGWRTSGTRVQRFYFTEAENSYAQAWGDGSAMGVIAVAAFHEAAPARTRQPSGAREAAPEADVRTKPRAGKSMQPADAASIAGTGFGESHDSHSVRVHFTPERWAFSQQFLKYEWRESLVRLGIIGEAPPVNRFWPQSIGHAPSYAPYPPGHWNRRR